MKTSHRHERATVEKRLASDEKRLTSLLVKQAALNAAVAYTSHKVKSAKDYLQVFDVDPKTLVGSTPAASPAASAPGDSRFFQRPAPPPPPPSPFPEVPPTQYRLPEGVTSNAIIALAKQAHDEPEDPVTYHRMDQAGENPFQNLRDWRALDRDAPEAYLAEVEDVPDEYVRMDVRDMKLEWGDPARLDGIKHSWRYPSLTPAQKAAVYSERERQRPLFGLPETKPELDPYNFQQTTSERALEMVTRRNNILREQMPDARLFLVAKHHADAPRPDCTGEIVERVGPLPAVDVINRVGDVGPTPDFLQAAV